MIARNNPTGQRSYLPQILLPGAVALYLYLNLFTFSGVPFLVIGDQTFFWDYAFRIFQGEHVYRDFFQFTPPGTDLFYLALLKLCGPSLWVVNFGLILLGLGLFALCFSVARCIMSRIQALLTAAIVIVLLFGERMDGTHHWFSLGLSLCAFRVVLIRRTPLRMIFSGALLGAAAFFTQTAGAAALLGLISALVWVHLAHDQEKKRTAHNILLLVTATGLTWAALSAPFVADVGWRKLFFLQVTYPHLYVRDGGSFIVPGIRSMMHLALLPRLFRQSFVYLSLAIYLPVLWRCWQKRHDEDADANLRIVFIAMLGVFLMLEVITRVNWTRIYVVATPALILLVWSITQFKSDRLRILAGIGAGLAIACLAVVQVHGSQHRQYTVTKLPSGTTALASTQCEEYSWIMSHTAPGDYFFQSNWLDVFFPLALRDPVFAEVLLPNERTRPEMVTLTVAQIEQKQVRYVLWAPQWAGPIVSAPATPDRLTPLRTYLKIHYVRVVVFSNYDEIWRRESP